MVGWETGRLRSPCIGEGGARPSNELRTSSSVAETGGGEIRLASSNGGGCGEVASSLSTTDSGPVLSLSPAEASTHPTQHTAKGPIIQVITH